MFLQSALSLFVTLSSVGQTATAPPPVLPNDSRANLDIESLNRFSLLDINIDHSPAPLFDTGLRDHALTVAGEREPVLVVFRFDVF